MRGTLYVATPGYLVAVELTTPPVEEMRSRLRDAPRSHLYALSILMAVYFSVAFSLSYLRLLEFTATNWDLGIFQQSLWTTTHGYTFFEVGDWETSGAVSFLQIHPAPILYLLVPFYALFPSPLTLLGIQSAAVALAALPLYQLGRSVLGESRRALAIAGLYLAYAPILTANLYDFHLESFLPLELFLLFLLWWQGRYFWAVVVAVAAFTTLEVTPFLVAAMAIYFMTRVTPSASSRSTRPARLDQSATWHRLRLGVRAYLSQPSVRRSLGLLLGSGASYLLLRAFQWWVLPAFLGVPPHPPAGATVSESVASIASIGLTLTFTLHLGMKSGYWLLLVGLLGFLPLLSPRALILAAPWFFFTMQADHIAWYQLGFQYGFLAAIPLLIGAIFGLRRLETSIVPWLRRGPSSRLRLERFRHPERGRRVALRVTVIISLVVLIGSNLCLTPLNPSEQNLNSGLSGYRVSYNLTPGYAAVAQAASLIPANALILASDNLFPFVANDAQAYSLLWIPQQPKYLPFDQAHLPTYAFLSTSQQYAEPSWLYISTSNRTLYGLLAVVTNSPAGTVQLWERGYSGPVAYAVEDTGPVQPAPSHSTSGAVGVVSARD